MASNNERLGVLFIGTATVTVIAMIAYGYALLLLAILAGLLLITGVVYFVSMPPLRPTT